MPQEHEASFLKFGERIISERLPRPQWLMKITEALFTGKSPEPQIPLTKVITDLQHIAKSGSTEKLSGYIEDLQSIQNEQTKTNQDALETAKKIEEIADTGRRIIVDGNASGGKTKAIVIASGAAAATLGLAGIGISIIAIRRRLKDTKTHHNTSENNS